MKFTRNKLTDPSTFWNGTKALPDEINVMSYDPSRAEFELLSIVCALHGYVTAFDLLTGAVSETEKDRDLHSIMMAFQAYLYPKMPLSNYTDTDHRSKPASAKKGVAIES